MSEENKKYEVRKTVDPLGLFSIKVGEIQQDGDEIRITENRGPFGIFGQKTKTIYREK